MNFPVVALKIKCRHLQISVQYGLTSPCFILDGYEGIPVSESLHRKLLDKACSMPKPNI